MRRYYSTFLRYFIIFLFGTPVFLLAEPLISIVYAALSELFPALFPIYSTVSSPNEAETLGLTLALIAGIVTVLLLTHIAVAYDNERYERMIAATDGFYTLREGAALYIPSYLAPDIISALLMPLLTAALCFIRIPEDAQGTLRAVGRTLDSYLSLVHSFTDILGEVGGILLLLLTSLAARVLSGWLGLRRWRALWLADIGR